MQQSKFLEANRMDAEFFIDTSSSLYQIKSIHLKEICKFIRTGPSGSKIPASSYATTGIPVIRPSNLDQLVCDNLELVYVLESFLHEKKMHEYTTGDILLSRIGDIKFGIVYGFKKTATISPNIIGIRVNQGILNPYYLLAFLQTELAQQQLNNGLKQVSLSSLALKDIEQLQIPQIPIEQQNEIGDCIRNALKKRVQAKKLLQKAEGLVMGAVETNSQSISIRIRQQYIALSKVIKAKRMDAEYLLAMDSRQIRTTYGKFIRLDQVAEITRGIEVGAAQYQEHGKLFLRVSNITKYGLSPKSQKYISEEIYKKLKQKYQPKAGDILLVKDGKPGVCFLIQKDVEGIISEGIVRVRTKNFDARYLTICISSDFCQKQIQMHKDGTLVPHWKIEQVKNLQIPLVELSIQKKIITYFTQAHNLIIQSKKFLRQAKAKIN